MMPHSKEICNSTLEGNHCVKQRGHADYHATTLEPVATSDGGIFWWEGDDFRRSPDEVIEDLVGALKEAYQTFSVIPSNDPYFLIGHAMEAATAALSRAEQYRKQERTRSGEMERRKR